MVSRILDGSTIKPLIDDRGMRPMPPNAASPTNPVRFPHAQSSSANDDDPKADGESTADDLHIWCAIAAISLSTGSSPVERALPLLLISIYAVSNGYEPEYTDGVLPELMSTTDEDWGNNPDLLRAYENILNDDLAGQTEQRKRARLLPKGLDSCGH
jgi:hypothetical protein